MTQIISNQQTTVAGTLQATGGALSGNGGTIETSSHQNLTITSSTKVDTSAPAGKTGTWLLDPYNLTIDSASASVISAALQNNNVTVQVQGNTCSGGTCTQGAGDLIIAPGVTIAKMGITPTTLTFLADGTFYNYGQITSAPSSILNVVINANDINLAQGSSIQANQVTDTVLATLMVLLVQFQLV